MWLNVKLCYFDKKVVKCYLVEKNCKNIKNVWSQDSKMCRFIFILLFFRSAFYSLFTNEHILKGILCLKVSKLRQKISRSVVAAQRF